MQELTSAELPSGDSAPSHRPAIAITYAIAGRFISIESPSESLADHIRQCFADWYLANVPRADDVRPHATIRVMTDAPPQPHPSLQPFDVNDGGVCHTDDNTYFFQSNGSAVTTDSRRSSAVDVWLEQNYESRGDETARVIVNGVMTALRRCGLYSVHAASVIAPRNAGILIAGPSGCGKSTLATALAHAGWRYLSDDTVVVYENNGGVEARALRRVFALTADTVAAAREFDLRLPNSGAEPFGIFKKRFEPDSIFPGRFAETCTPNILLFPRITNERTTHCRRLSRAETMSQLIRICPWACYDKAVAEAHLQTLAGLARQAEGFELLSGTDLLDPEYAARYLIEQVPQVA